MKKILVNKCGNCQHRIKKNNQDYCNRQRVNNPPLCLDEMLSCDIYRNGFEKIPLCAICPYHKINQFGEMRPFDEIYREMGNENRRKLHVEWTQVPHWCEKLEKEFNWTPKYIDDSDGFFPKECPLEDVSSEEMGK